LYPIRLVKKGQVMHSNDKQDTLGLAFGVHRGPKDAPAKVVRQIDTDAQALAVSMLAGGCKLAYVAACVGKSESYVSLMRSGKRPIPERLIGPLCAATQSNLLRQFHQLQTALGEVCEVERLADLLRSAA
jgi:hypothetical protein